MSDTPEEATEAPQGEEVVKTFAEFALETLGSIHDGDLVVAWSSDGRPVWGTPEQMGNAPDGSTVIDPGTDPETAALLAGVITMNVAQMQFQQQQSEAQRGPNRSERRLAQRQNKLIIPGR